MEGCHGYLLIFMADYCNHGQPWTAIGLHTIYYSELAIYDHTSGVGEFCHAGDIIEGIKKVKHVD